MNPCDICKERILVYPGVCDACNLERKMKFENEWKATYKASTAKHEQRDPWAGFQTDNQEDR